MRTGSGRSRLTIGHRWAVTGDRGVEPLDLASASDAALVVAIARGDEAALAELYRRHAPVVYGLALRLLGDADAAQEVLQEVVVALWERPERFNPARGALRSHLLRMAHGKAVDRIRAESRRARREENCARQELGGEVDLDREVWELVRAETVREALATLTDGERKAIELAYFGGRSYREVAAAFGEAEGTIKTRIRTGLRKLADRLEAAGLGPNVRDDR